MKIVFQVLRVGSGGDVYYESLSKELQKIGIDNQIIFYNKWFQFFPYFLKFFKKEVACDIIHSEIEYAWVFKKKGTPLVVSAFHLVFDKQFQKHTSFFQKIYHYLILKSNIKKSIHEANKIICISKYTNDAVKKMYGCESKIQLIYPGIDFNIFKPLNVKKYDKGKFHLIFVGNLIKRKGVDLLPKIMKKLGKNYMLSYTSGLRTKPSNNFDLPNMILLGKLSEEELVKKYNESDALLAPSRLEGFGYQIAEAMACGKPVIATDYSSIPELIKNEENGFLCQLNSIDDFVLKIIKLGNNPKLRLKMGKANRERVIDKFGIDRMCRKIENLYLNLIK